MRRREREKLQIAAAAVLFSAPVIAVVLMLLAAK
jgi:hypothetical protein